MTHQKNTPEVTARHQSLSQLAWLLRLMRRWWFSPAVILTAAICYYAPYLTFDKALVGSDDGPRGWHTYKNYGHAITSFRDIWSPLNGGTAMIERRFGRFISPMYPLHLFLKKYQQRTIEYIFWTVVAALSMLWYLRVVGVRRSVATIMAFAFMLSPALLSNIYTGHYVKMQVIALMPAVMAFVERLLTKASLLDVAGLPALLALAIYSEHLQLAFFLFVGMGLYFAARMLYEVIGKKIALRQAVLRTSYFTAALIIGALITSMNTFPSMHHAGKVSKRAGGVDYAYASSFSLHPEELVAFVVPDFVGWAQYYWGRNALKLNSEYFGVITVLLAIILFFIRKQSFQRWLLATIAVGALLFALGAHTPVHRIAYKWVPGIKIFRAPSMAYIWLYFSSFVLAAFALQELLALAGNVNSWLWKRLRIFGSVAGGVAVFYMLGSKAVALWWYRTVMPLNVQCEERLRSLQAHLPALSTGAAITFAVIACFLGVTLAYLKGRLRQKQYLAILAGLFVVDLVRISYPFMTQCARPHNFFSRREAWERSIAEFITRQDSGLYRVHSLFDDQKMYIPGLDFTYVFDDFTDQQYHEIIQQVQLYSRAIMQPEYARDAQVQTIFRNMLSFLNTKYILVPGAIAVPGFTELINSGGFRIYRNETCFPRAHLASVVIEADSKKALFDRFASPGFAPNFAIVEEKDSVVLAGSEGPVDTSIVDQVMVQQWDSRTGRIVVVVQSSRRQMLVLAENHTPGWTAQINGTPAKVLEVNYAWKGVVVPVGVSKVELMFDSPIARQWRKVTAVSWIIYGMFVLLVIGRFFYSHRRKRA